MTRRSVLGHLLIALVLALSTVLVWHLAPDGDRSAATGAPDSSTIATPSPTAPAASSVADEEPEPTLTDKSLASGVLAQLPVKGRAPRTGYDRALFGQRWADVDRNGCDQRNDILDRDLVDKTYRPGTRDCVVLTGTLHDPYTGTIIEFVRGEITSQEVQIDHVVALSDAWQKGAGQLDEETRRLFANDPLNLLAVDGPSNMAKGDGDAATWLPPNRAFRCDFVARQVAVKHRYDLWVTEAERDAIERVLASCPGQVVPEDRTVPNIDDTWYPNCDAVRDAGRAPLPSGEPGYRPGLDRDGNGIACE